MHCTNSCTTDVPTVGVVPPNRFGSSRTEPVFLPPERCVDARAIDSTSSRANRSTFANVLRTSVGKNSICCVCICMVRVLYPPYLDSIQDPFFVHLPSPRRIVRSVGARRLVSIHPFVPCHVSSHHTFATLPNQVHTTHRRCGSTPSMRPCCSRLGWVGIRGMVPSPPPTRMHRSIQGLPPTYLGKERIFSLGPCYRHPTVRTEGTVPRNPSQA